MGGNASDKQIVKESGLLDLLEKGDSVMAVKGFLIQDLLATRCYPEYAPKTRLNRQLSRKEVEQTRKIAAVRIHVEWKMEQIRILEFCKVSSQQQNGMMQTMLC